MLKIKFSQGENKKCLYFKANGHASRGADEEKLICAGATMLAYTLAQCIMDLYNNGLLRAKPKIKLESGNSYVHCSPKSESYAEALHCFFVAQTGYSLMTANFPDNVELIRFDEAKASSDKKESRAQPAETKESQA